MSVFSQKLIPDEIRKVVIERTEKGLYDQIIIGVISGDNTEFLVQNNDENHLLNEQSPVNASSLLPFFLSFQLYESISKGVLNPLAPLNDYLPKEVKLKDKSDKKSKFIHAVLHGIHPQNFPELLYEQGYNIFNIDKESVYENLKTYSLAVKHGSYYEQTPFSLQLMMSLMSDITHIKPDVYLNNLFESRHLVNSFVAKSQVREYMELPGLVRKTELKDYFYGAVYISPEDLLTLIRQNILGKEGSDYRKLLAGNDFWFPAYSDHFKTGFALNALLTDRDMICFQQGNYLGHQFFFAFDTFARKAVVVYSASGFPADDIGFYLMGQQKELYTLGDADSSEIRVKISGEYYSDGENGLTIVRKDQDYYLYWGTVGGFLIQALHKNEYVSIFPGIQFHFSMDENEEVILKVVERNGKVKYYNKK